MSSFMATLSSLRLQTSTPFRFQLESIRLADDVSRGDGAPSSEHEAQALRTQAEHLEGTLDQIKKRLAELDVVQEGGR